MLSGVRHSWSSYLIALVVGSLCLLIQFISSHGLQLLSATSWIFVLKKYLSVYFTTFLKVFQLFKLFNVL